jgi:cysteine desulfurase/selenocysteine lyase
MMTMVHKNHTKIRKLFPALKGETVYLDSAATTLKPIPVIDKLLEYYQEYTANVHRSAYKMAEKANSEYESARCTVQKFINASSPEEIIITRGSTEATNLIALSWGEQNIKKGDRILISILEHHSNILPWQKLAERKEAQVDIIPITIQGDIDLENFQNLLNNKVKLIGITGASNVIGTLTPLEKIISLGHSCGTTVFVDAAQAAAHIPIDVQKLNCDFLCLSAHKVYGPTGVGVLYGKRFLLENMPPIFYGGGMADRLRLNGADYELPHKFEAGTPPIASLIAFGSAIEFVQDLGFENICNYEEKLLKEFYKRLNNFPELSILGTPQKRIGVCSILAKNIHAHDLGTLLDAHGISVRVGHHCASPLMKHYGISSTLRISFGIYNNLEDIEKMIYSLKQIVEMFK